MSTLDILHDKINAPGSSHCFVVWEPGSEVKLHPFLQNMVLQCSWEPST